MTATVSQTPPPLPSDAPQPGGGGGGGGDARSPRRISSLLAHDCTQLLSCVAEGLPCMLPRGQAAVQLRLRPLLRGCALTLTQLHLLPHDDDEVAAAASRCGSKLCACAVGANPPLGSLPLPRVLSDDTPLALLFVLPACAAAARVRLCAAASPRSSCAPAAHAGAARLPPPDAPETAAAAGWAEGAAERAEAPQPPAELFWNMWLDLPTPPPARVRITAPPAARVGERLRVRYDLLPPHADSSAVMPTPNGAEWRLDAPCARWLLLSPPCGWLALTPPEGEALEAGDGSVGDAWGSVVADCVALREGHVALPSLALRLHARAEWVAQQPLQAIDILFALAS
jgi:hypothetical protein